MIYLDNAATTYKKPLAVKLATLKGITSANPGRSGHKLSIKAANEITKTRLKLQALFNVPDTNNIILTHNCTEALNMAILGSAKKGHVIASTFEHNSVLRPLKKLQDDGIISLTIITPKSNNIITASDIIPALQNDTYLVCVSYVTNTLGNKNDINGIGKLCKEKNLLLLCDCAQAAGHIDIDMQKDNISMLAFAGHKGLFAPQSIGGLCLNNVSLSPLKYGGTGTNSTDLNMPQSYPERLESGTLHTPLIFGLSAGIDYVINHFEKSSKKVKRLTQYLLQELYKLGATVYTNKDSFLGVVLFNLLGFDSTELSDILSEKYGIMLRGGLHCAPLAHKYLGTLKQGALRVSINHYNSAKQINKLITALQDILTQE